MAGETNTLAGLIQMNDLNLADIDVSDLLEEAPLLQVLNAVTASNGTQHKYEKQTIAPGVAFRDPNTGIVNTAGKRELVSVDLKLMDAGFDRDKAIAMGYKAGKEAYMSKESIASLKTAFSGAEKQIINGTDADASGNTGFADALGTVGDKVISAGGAVADVQTSVYLIREGDDDVSAVMGNDGDITMSDMFDNFLVTNQTTGAGYDTFRVSILGWMGVQMGSVQSAVRIANLDATATLDDAELSKAIAKFPAGKGPSYIVMNRQSLQQLQDSRTATNVTGVPAPFPTEAFGIPIVVTDSITSTEAIVTA